MLDTKSLETPILDPTTDADPFLRRFETLDLLSHYCYQLHSEFDQQWLQTHQASFHNQFHVFANVEFSRTICQAAVKSNFDPLGLLEQLDLHNQLLTEEMSSLDPHIDATPFLATSNDLTMSFTLAMLVHDLGDIAKKNPSGEIEFLNAYTFEDSENRSLEIALDFISQAKFLNKDQKQRIIPLVLRIVTETTSDLPSDHTSKPFALATRYIDQIGNEIMNHKTIIDKDKQEILQQLNPYYQQGLLEEIINLNPNATIKNPYNFINFATNRLTDLNIDLNTHQKIMQLFPDHSFRPLDESIPKTEMSALDLLSLLPSPPSKP